MKESKNPHYPPERIQKMLDGNIRAGTRFGAENANPRHNEIPGGNAPHSIAQSVRYLAKQKLKVGQTSLEKHLPPEPTMAQVIAANTLTKAAKGDMRAVEYCTDRIDGKTWQPNLNADMADIEKMSDEEIHAELQRLRDAQSRISGDEDAESSGASQEGDGDASQQAEGLPGTDTTSGV